MIVRPRPSGIEYFFLLRGSILPNIWLRLVITIATSVVVTITHGALYHFKVTLTTIPFSLMALALAIFLGFRNSASYDRFWEGRKLWGALANEARNLARQSHAYINAGGRESVAVRDMRRRISRSAIAFAHTLRHQLRGTDPAGDIRRLLPEERVTSVLGLQNPAAAILNHIGNDVAAATARGWLTLHMAQEIDRSVGRLVEVLGGCERINNTPLPFSYAVLLHRTVYAYCYLLPFGLVDSIGMLTPIVVGIVSYTFFGLDAIGDEIEEPFGTTTNDLPLRALSVGIEISVRELTGDGPLPSIPLPVDFCLE